MSEPATPVIVFLSLTNIRHSNTGFGARTSFQLVYGYGADSLTMRRCLCLREEKRGGEAGGNGLEIHVLESNMVHVRETRRDELRQTHHPRSYELPFGQRAVLEHGGRMMGGIVPMEGVEHAARIELCRGIVLEVDPIRYTRCWFCLAIHQIRRGQTVCGQQGCRAILPQLAIPYPLENPGFQTTQTPLRRINS